jgi:hypothetical protein
VVAQIRTVLTSPESIASVVRHIQRNGAQIDEATTVMAMGRLNDVWDQLFPAEQTRIVKLLVEKVIVSPNDLEVRLRANGIERLVLELRPEPVEQQAKALA